VGRRPGTPVHPACPVTGTVSAPAGRGRCRRPRGSAPGPVPRVGRGSVQLPGRTCREPPSTVRPPRRPGGRLSVAGCAATSRRRTGPGARARAGRTAG
jgi:hypothetical protein